MNDHDILSICEGMIMYLYPFWSRASITNYGQAKFELMDKDDLYTWKMFTNIVIKRVRISQWINEVARRGHDT